MTPANPPSVTAPPPAPDITQQQGPISQFMKRGGNAQVANFNPLQFAEQRLNQVALAMRDVAKILVNVKPELMPVWEKMMQAGTMLMNEVQKASQGAGPQGPGAQPSPGQDQGTQDSGPDQGPPQVG